MVFNQRYIILDYKYYLQSGTYRSECMACIFFSNKNKNINHIHIVHCVLVTKLLTHVRALAIHIYQNLLK